MAKQWKTCLEAQLQWCTQMCANKNCINTGKWKRKSLLSFKAVGILPLDSEMLECHPKHIRKYKLMVSGKTNWNGESSISILEQCILKRSILVWHCLVTTYSRSAKWLLSSDKEVGYWNCWGFSVPACLTLSLISVLKIKRFDMVL